jgi:hypothetical protein
MPIQLGDFKSNSSRALKALNFRVYLDTKPFVNRKDCVGLYPNEYNLKCTFLRKQLNLINGLAN